MLVAELAQADRELCGRRFLVESGGLAVGGDDHRGEVARVALDRRGDAAQVVEVEVVDVLPIAGNGALDVGIAPGKGAMVGAVGDQDRALAGVGAGEGHRERGDVGAVLREQRPGAVVDHRHQLLRQVDHDRRGAGAAVDLGVLAGDRLLHLGVQVTEHDRAPGAHHVDVLVADHVPDPGPFGTGDEMWRTGPVHLRGEVSGDASGEGFRGSFVELEPGLARGSGRHCGILNRRAK